jgi:hypothetical protein
VKKGLALTQGVRYGKAMTTKPLPPKVITLDMDGTVFDPWACCGRKDHTYVGTKDCRHLRSDTLRKVKAIMRQHPTVRLVVLSWRSGMEQVTREWLGHVGIYVTHVFIPRSADAEAIGAKDAGQVGFKVNVAKALMAQGVEIVGAFEDNPDVVAGLQGVGVPAERVEHLVEVHKGKVAGKGEDWYNAPSDEVTRYTDLDWGQIIANTREEAIDWDACNRNPFGRQGELKMARGA